MLIRILVLAACAFTVGGALAQVGSTHSTTEGSPVNILYIGNSYTYSNQMPSIVSAMGRAETSSRQMRNKLVVVPGATLQVHWESGVAQMAIQARKWDYVVLQEQSLLPLEDRELMFKHVRLFDKEIKRSGAKTVLFLTWARRYRPETQVDLNAAYFGIAQELGATVAPVGPAWAIALRAPDVPDLYEGDGSHPTQAGSYLTACVLYLVIQGSGMQCPVKSRGSVSVANAAALGAAAVTAVSQRK